MRLDLYNKSYWRSCSFVLEEVFFFPLFFIKMMVRMSSGKFGYLLYSGTSCEKREETFTRRSFGLWDNARALALPELSDRVQKGKLNFLAWKVFPFLTDLTVQVTSAETNDLELIVGDDTTPVSVLLSLLSPSECLYGLTQKGRFLYVPDGASAAEKAVYDEDVKRSGNSQKLIRTATPEEVAKVVLEEPPK